MKIILIIEDIVEVNENLCEILKLSGYEVVSAFDGIKGIELANSVLPDLILCDVMMPHLDGYGVLKILSQNERTAHIPLIFLTAKSEMQDLRKGMSLGAADYILKPFDDADLLQSIAVRLAKNNPSSGKSNLLKHGIDGLGIDKRLSELKKAWTDKYETRFYEAKSNIYSSDGLPRHVLFITKGIVRIQKTNNIGKRITIALLNADTLCGEYAVIQNKPHLQDANASTACEIIHIPIADFIDLLQKDSTFTMYCYSNAILRTEEMNRAYLEMAYSSVRRKVAISLIRYARAYYNNTLEDGLSIYLPREELAELVGSAKETIIRTLSDFRTEGLIEINNHNIILSDVEGLLTMEQ